MLDKQEEFFQIIVNDFSVRKKYPGTSIMSLYEDLRFAADRIPENYTATQAAEEFYKIFIFGGEEKFNPKYSWMFMPKRAARLETFSLPAIPALGIKEGMLALREKK